MPKAFSALILVIVITVASLALALSSVWLGLGQLSLNQAWQNSELVRQTAETCAEIALLHLQNDESYQGGNLSLAEESCIINVNKNGSPWTSAVLSIVGKRGDWHKALRLDVVLNGQDLTITSWQETSL